MFFVAAILVFAVFWVVTMLYLRSAHGLVNRLRIEHPEFWHDRLGAPKFVAHHRQHGFTFQYRFYLQPLLPFLRWILAGSAAGLDTETRRHHGRTKRLAIASGLGFLVTLNS